MDIVKVVVLLSSFNGEKYIQKQIESIINQSGVEVKLLIRDDGSTDKTLEIIQNFSQKYNNIEIIIGKNEGYAKSFSHLIKKASTLDKKYQFFAFADQDDYWLPSKLKVACNQMLNFSDKIPVAYCSNTILVDENLNYIKHCNKQKSINISKENSIFQNFGTGCTMVFNRCAIDLYSTHTPSDIKLHDYWMYQICAFLGAVIYDANSYIYYRQHGNNEIGVPSFLKRMQQRLKGYYKQHVTENRNKSFLIEFQDMLTIQDKELLNIVTDYRSSFGKKVDLIKLFNSNYIGSVESKLLQIVKILMGYL